MKEQETLDFTEIQEQPGSGGGPETQRPTTNQKKNTLFLQMKMYVQNVT